MELKKQHLSGALVVSPTGRIDPTSADDFKLALEPCLDDCKTGGVAVVLDLAGVSYISSVGLRVLMLAARRVRAQGGSIVVAALTPVVSEVFEISRFNLVYNVFPDVAAALGALADAS